MDKLNKIINKKRFTDSERMRNEQFNGFPLMANSFCIDIVRVLHIHRVVYLGRARHSMDIDIWA